MTADETGRPGGGMAKRARVSSERGEHDAALTWLMLVLEQETEHVTNLAPASVSDIGRPPDPAP